MDSTALKAYLGNISSVKVGDNRYSKASFWWNVKLSYKPDVVDSSSSISDYDCLKLTTDGFSTEGNTVVTIKVDGYTDLAFTVSKDGELVTDNNAGGSESGGNTSGGTEENPGTSGVTVPTEKPAIEKDSSGYHILTFKGSEAWVGQITGIKVGSDLYKEETSVYNLQNGRFVKDATHGIVYIQFPSNTFGNSDVDYNVVIAAGSNIDNLKLKVTIPSGFFGTPTVEIVND